MRFFSSLLIGAPRDHTVHDIITRRGAVWKCEFRFDDRCQRVPFRRDGSMIYLSMFLTSLIES